MSALTKSVIVISILVASIFVYFSWRKNVQSFASIRPEIIFLNQTNNHAFDTALTMSLHIAREKSAVENALVLLDKLPPGTTVEDLAGRLFERWRIGETTSGKGILYLYSQAENVFRIHVSYELEGVLPDILCRGLEEASKTYMLSEVPQDFLSELIITTNLIVAGEKDVIVPSRIGRPFLSGGAGFSAQGYKGTIKNLKADFPMLDLEQKKSWNPSDSVAETISLYFKSLDEGLSEPNLPILTEGSQIFRIVVPRSRAQLKRIKKFYNQAGGYEVFKNDRWATAAFKPGQPNLPVILLKGHDGLWRVDEAKSWTYFHRFENSSDVWAKYVDVPFFDELKRKGFVVGAIYGNRVTVPPPASLQLLESDASFAARGEIYLHEINWIRKAIEMYEKASKQNPKNVEYLWKLYDLYINHSEVEKALATLKKITEISPADAMANEWLNFYSKTYEDVKKKARWDNSKESKHYLGVTEALEK